MPHRVSDLENPLLAQQRLDLVSRDNVAFLERFDGEVLAGVSILRQNNFAEMSAAKYAEKTEAVKTHALNL